MVETNNIPRHVAIIMDGNGRWARSRGKERLYGHIQGVETVRETLKAARSAGVEYLTLFVFSTENWGRPQDEVNGLMELLCKSIIGELPELLENGVRVKVIGDRLGMPETVTEHIAILEEKTSECSDLTLVLALNYGSREEITYAVKRIVSKAAAGETDSEQITPETISENLYTYEIPDPDLLIRTSGELRLSNFLLWQTAYTEFFFTDTYWPDFTRENFSDALAAYAVRERRYGLINSKKPENAQ